MNDKVVIITGANSGIGKAATIRYATEGYTVVMACRNLEKSKKIQSEIIELSHNDNLDLIELDISSFKSIKSFCTQFKSKYKKLDILIHNAARFKHGEKNYQLSNENVELTFATNTVGPYFMTQLLIDMLKQSDDARVLHACSTNIRYYFDLKRKIDFDNLQGEFIGTRKYDSYKLYGDSKMALLMLAFKMADIYKADGIKVNALQIPATKISKDTIKNMKPIWRIAAKLQQTFSLSREMIADTYYYICTSNKFKDVTGKIINHKSEIMRPTHYGSGLVQEIKQLRDKSIYPRYADSINNIERVWEMCESFTKVYI